MLERIIYSTIVLLCLNASVTLAADDMESEPESPESSSFRAYDGQWDFALGFEFSEMPEFDAGDFGWGFILGKDLYENDSISLGAQLHFSRSFLDDPDEDLAIRDSTNLFATSHFKGFPAVKFKLGVSYTKLETDLGDEKDNGMVFGLDIRLPIRSGHYFTMISYENSISGEDYQALFLT